MIVIFLSKDEFAKIFTNSEDMIRAVADLAYLLGVSIMSGDCLLLKLVKFIL